MTTADLLHALEKAGRVASADIVLRKAVEQARPRRVLMRAADEGDADMDAFVDRLRADHSTQ